MDVGFPLALMGCSFIVATLIYPYVLSFAKKHGIVDNPSVRKLQRVPVPVMGGTTAFIGMIAAVVVGFVVVPDERLLKIMGLLAFMYIIGLWDDIKDISAAFRFILELLVVWLVMWSLGLEINNLHGLWGIYQMPEVISVPLSLVAGVGIMNAINLIDGVDGYCSMYSMIACAAFAVIFFYAGDMSMFTLALIAIGALIPFFFHNVFGKLSKMFMGDSGSLMLGILFAIFVFNVLSLDPQSVFFDDIGLSLPAVVLAILAVPVFDTLKVMIFRVKRGVSPFHPDKTHLHHLFIDMNFSHLLTSGVIVFANLLMILFLLVGWRLGLSMDGQLYLVIAMALLFTWGFYFWMIHEHQKNGGDGSELWKKWSEHAKATNISSTVIWKLIQRIADSKLFGVGFLKKHPENNE